MLALVLALTLQALSLDEVVERAEQHHPQLRQARGATAAAEAQAELARAPLLPQLGANLAYQRSTGNYVVKPGSTPPATSGLKPATTTLYNFFTANLTASQTVFDLGAFQGYGAARALASSQRALERLAGADVRVGAQLAYFNAWAMKALVDVAREAATNQERHVTQIQGYVRAGSRPAIDLAQVRADRANAQVQLINAEDAYDIARAQLAQAMGEDGPASFEVGDDRLPPVPGEDGEGGPLVSEAMAARADLSALEEQVRAQELLVGQAWGGYLPQLGVSATATAAGEQTTNLTPNWNVLLTLSVPLFQGLGTRAQVGQAAATLDALLGRRDALRQQIWVDVESARLRVRAAKAAGVAARDALANARDRLKLAEGRYHSGIGSVIELGDAQVALTNAAAQRVQADFGLAAARALLLRALQRP